MNFTSSPTISWCCPFCQMSLTVPATLAGVTGSCPNCAQVIKAPEPAPANLFAFAPPAEAAVSLPWPPMEAKPHVAVEPLVIMPQAPSKPKSEGGGLIWVALLCLAGFFSYMVMFPLQSVSTTAPLPNPSSNTTLSAGELLALEAVYSPDTFGESLRAHHATIQKRDDRYSELQDELSSLHDQQDEMRPGSAAFERLQQQVYAIEREIEAAVE
jgi:hypothetical protein